MKSRWGRSIGAALAVGRLVLGACNGGQEGNHTLRWDTHNPSATRFTTVFSGAVLDKNTGLVWEQAPDAINTIPWDPATFFCVNKNVGGTVGWRLPSVAELKSVQDGLPGAVAPFVPAIFTGVQSDEYWSATTYAGDPTTAWAVSFSTGDVPATNKALSHRYWAGVCAVA
ncbi:MAG TPA: DUF1566 domain-containing protein [Nitrospiraceae bacterium]|nr:DUF1566 domain-containing protein [Nitrospiraceae bacterium]